MTATVSKAQERGRDPCPRPTLIWGVLLLYPQPQPLWSKTQAALKSLRQSLHRPDPNDLGVPINDGDGMITWSRGSGVISASGYGGGWGGGGRRLLALP